MDALLWSGQQQDDPLLRQQALADRLRGFKSEVSEFQTRDDIENWKKSKKDWSTQLMNAQPKMPSMGGTGGGVSGGMTGAGDLEGGGAYTGMGMA